MVLPIVASETFAGGAAAYGFMTAAMGVGAVVGGLVRGCAGRTGLRSMVVGAVAFGVRCILAAALSPTLLVALLRMGLVGAASVAFHPPATARCS